MRLVQTLVVRDEADVVDTQIAYHQSAGVDFVIATDHESRDGTVEILRSYERDGYLQVIRVRGEVRESEWRTRMARLAATEHAADWVINTDADEFWIPRGGTLKDVLGAVPEKFGVLWALTRHFVPRPHDEDFFAERMTARVRPQAAINDPASPYRPHAKAAHRSDPTIVVGNGSHTVFSQSLAPLRNWYPADVFHFPVRSLRQYEQKNVRGAATPGYKPMGQYVKAFQAQEEGRIADAYRSLVVDDATLKRGCADGSLVVDTRLRDALRLLLPEHADRDVGQPAETTEADADATTQGAVLLEADGVRLTRWLDELEARLAAVEQRAWAREVGRSDGGTAGI